MNNTIYDFFKDNYGTIDSVNQANGPFHKYNHLTIKQLKRELAQLKRQNTPLTEVRYVSRLLRSKLGNSPGTAKSNDSVKNYGRFLHKNFWASSKIFSRRVSLFCLLSHKTTVQNFSLTSSVQYFRRELSILQVGFHLCLSLPLLLISHTVL